MHATDSGTPLDHWLEQAWARAAAVHEVEVEGAMVRYRGWGLAASDKPALLFAHGFLAHARWWDHIAPHFADRYRIAALDFTGMGDSDHRPTYSRKQYAREILAVAQHAGMESMTAICHSFGSVSALYAAKMAPERIDHVIVIDAHVFREETEQAAPPVTPQRTYGSLEEALGRYRLIPPGVWPIPAIVRYFGEHSLKQADGRWTWKFDPELIRSASPERIRDEIRGLDISVNFVHATNSDVVGPAEVASFVANMPGCRGVVTVPLSHHHIMIEQPVGLVAALSGILGGRG